MGFPSPSSTGNKPHPPRGQPQVSGFGFLQALVGNPRFPLHHFSSAPRPFRLGPWLTLWPSNPPRPLGFPRRIQSAVEACKAPALGSAPLVCRQEVPACYTVSSFPAFPQALGREAYPGGLGAGPTRKSLEEAARTCGALRMDTAPRRPDPCPLMLSPWSHSPYKNEAAAIFIEGPKLKIGLEHNLKK